MFVLPDVMQPNLKVVFCGTAVGAKSAQVGAYYAGPGNRFWETLFKVGLTPRKLAPHEFRTLTDFGIGLTDLSKTGSGADSGLRRGDFDAAGFRAKIEQFVPKVLAFNGKRAAQEFYERQVEYGLQPEAIGTTAVFVLPSTSGAARGFWDEAWWWKLAEVVNQE
jgi:double-stranded uracil-DNA glycosylase